VVGASCTLNISFKHKRQEMEKQKLEKRKKTERRKETLRART
jgi:hypothetical protein